MHTNIRLELAEKGILPLLNQDEWISREIPYSADQVDEAFPNRPSHKSAAYWFRKNTRQRAVFSLGQATESDPVDPAEVEEFVRRYTGNK